MEITLKKAAIQDCEQIHQMQIAGFKALLDKYQDFDASPGNESLEKIKWRFEYEHIDHYFIQLQNEKIGYIRINRLDESSCRLSQMFVLPEYQGNGYGQQAIAQAELLYPQAKHWILDTIKQEPKLRHFYEKMGYRLTGTEKNIKADMDLVDYAK
jgi:Predicted P-loop ATPase fused to an acetyltransferase